MSENAKDEEVQLPVESADSSAVDVRDSRDIEIEKLRKQLADREAALAEERNSRQSFEVQAQQRIAVESSARMTAEENSVKESIEAADKELLAAKQNQVLAYNAGDFVKAAEYGEAIAVAAARRHDATARKAYLESVRMQAQQSPLQQPAQQQTFSDPADMVISQVKSATSKRWLAAHRDVAAKMGTDRRFAAKVASLDSAAVAEGIVQDSPEYFSFLEEGLGLGDEKSVASVAAVSRRSRAPETGSRTMKLTDVVQKLTPSMRSAAIMSFPNLSEEDAYKAYARGLVLSKSRDSSFLPEFKL